MISVNLLKQTPFPLFLSKILSPITNKLFGLSSYGIFALISGLLSGYPIGAKLVSELYTEKKLSKSEAQYLLSFTNNSGPLFIIGTVGTIILNNKNIGFFLLLIHYLSALTIGLILKRPKTKIYTIKSSSNFSVAKEIKNSILNSIESIVQVGGYIIFFSILCTIFTKLLSTLNLNFYLKSLLYGILEITNGCKELNKINQLQLSLISLIIAFGGFSIHMQSSNYISNTDLSFTKYFFSKVLQGILAFLFCFVLFPFYKK